MNKFFLFLTLAIGLNSFGAHATNDIPVKEKPSTPYLIHASGGVLTIGVGALGILSAKDKDVDDALVFFACAAVSGYLWYYAQKGYYASYELPRISAENETLKSDIAALKLIMGNKVSKSNLADVGQIEISKESLAVNG